MRKQEFAYWLQGYFEISGGTSISLDAAALIKEKLENAKKDKATQSADFDHFLGQAEAFITILVSDTTDPGTRELLGKEISKALNDLFVHAIDPSYKGDQKQFGKIHKPNGNGYTGMRC